MTLTIQEEIELGLLIGDVVTLQRFQAVGRETKIREESIELRVVERTKDPTHLVDPAFGAELIGRPQQHLWGDPQGDLAGENVGQVGERILVDPRTLDNDLTIVGQIDGRTAVPARALIFKEQFELHETPNSGSVDNSRVYI